MNAVFDIVRTLKRVFDGTVQSFLLSILSYASPVWHPNLARSLTQVKADTALWIATDCIRSNPTARLHCEVKVEDYLDLRGTQISSSAEAPKHTLHGSLKNSLGTWRQIYTTPSSHNMMLRAMILRLSLGNPESSKLHESFVARDFTKPAKTFLDETTLFISPNEVDLHGRTECMLLASNAGTIWPFAHMRTAYVRKQTICRLCGDTPETVSHTFQESSQLAGDRVKFEMSNPTDLWGES